MSLKDVRGLVDFEEMEVENTVVAANNCNCK